ncbi:hypothetical protein NFG81_07665 [Bacillus paralicheniformis]|uniref:hypothetical protein n=1 Tax=Bacillus TaxID=1386 RepID=UPI0011BFE185|nr:hypothetical protein [Bacillus paralicheniformis]KAA0840625.1 hypothetical protein EI977_10075 [Bacillus paralicheniformis]KAA0841750.1 hypothetical protein EI979_10720 [Bacillus paralicheniformis]MCB6217214.1 hypothetical protein [Bacillus paralicheniformis]MCQ5455229.1 hypothetical protein [Bacillus paralicheniformis]MDR9799489.1 hypothetical protein [Bacillus paralicheniformis]
MDWNAFVGFIKEYLPVITVVLSAFIAFISTIRHKDLERFYKNAENNLEKVIEPMYLKVKNIENIKDGQHKIELIKDFFDIYDSKKMNISKLGNRQLINKFFETEKAFNQYILKFDEESLKSLFFKVRSLKYNLEKEYWRLFETIYKDYNWYKKTVDMNYLFRFFLRISFFIESTLYAVTWISFGFVMFVIFDGVSVSEAVWVENFKEDFFSALIIFISSLATLYISMFINFAFADDTKQKKKFVDYASAGLTYVWNKMSLKIREWKEERANRKVERERERANLKEERERAARSEEND